MRHPVVALVLAVALAPHSPARAAVPAAETSPPQARPSLPPRGAAASGITTEETIYGAFNEKVHAYLARPAGSATSPGIVIIHEWWGLNDQIKGVAERFARQGYVAIVPDLYKGKVASDPELAHELARGLDEGRVVQLVRGAIMFLRSLDGAKERPVATVGFCMGGGLSLASALQGAPVQSAVMFYGAVKTTPEAVRELRVPLLGLFGAEDRGIPVDDVHRFEEALKSAGKTATIRVYPGVGHAFFNEHNPLYKQEIADQAWGEVMRFLGSTLKPGA